jgi:hypothetical protein
MRLFVLSFLTLLILFSCSNYPTEEVALTLVFDRPLLEGKYPSYFKEFAMPYNAENCEKAILFKPIYYVRADISRTEKESNAWYFKNIGENTVEFSTNFLTQFYTDSLVPQYLTRKSEDKNLNIDSYLNNKEDVVFIFSEESALDDYNGTPIIHTARKIQEMIKETACSNTGKKVTIIINPSELSHLEPEIVERTDGEINSESHEIKGDPCSQNTVTDGLDLKEDLMQIVDTKHTYKERDRLARETWKKYFDPMASVTFYVKANQKYPEGFFESGDGANYFIDRLAYMSSITNLNITRIEYHKDTPKISGIVIVECHNASEIQ